MIHRFSTVNIDVASGGGVRVTSNSTSTTQSTGDTGGFVYEAPGVIRNLSGRNLVCLVSYGLIWSNAGAPTLTRLAWLQLDNTTERYAMSCILRATFDPTQTGSAIIVIPNNSTITLWVFQNSGSTHTLLAQWGMPYLSITVI